MKIIQVGDKQNFCKKSWSTKFQCMLSPRYHQHFYRNQKLLEYRNTRINCKIDKFVEFFTYPISTDNS